MAKFFVVVNNKWMVSVEANGLLGAERKVLDTVMYGVNSALAFDTKKDVKTPYFMECLATCETVSLSELVVKAHEIELDAIKAEQARTDARKVKECMDMNAKTIEGLKNQLAELEKMYATHAKKLEQYEKTAKAYDEKANRAI